MIMIKAVILDMDGLLIDSEPLWQEASKKVFAEVGVFLDSEQMSQTMGLRIDEVVGHWFKRFPWKKRSKKQVEEDIVNEVIQRVKQKGKEKEGVREIISFFSQKHIPMAVASSSPKRLIEPVLQKLGILDRLEFYYSAENEEFGKPHPGVYLTTSKKLGVKPAECLAFEDSPNGVTAAKAAGMKCVAIPDQSVRGDERFKKADLSLPSLKNFNQGHFEKLSKFVFV